jgi:O-antigen ligase
VKIIGLKPESPLFIAGLRDGDTLLTLDDRPLNNLDEIYHALEAPATDAQPARIAFYRFEWIYSYKVPRGQLLGGATPLERLGLRSWQHGRDWRAMGFHGDYTVYAEILQLVGCLALGLLVALRRKLSWQGALLALAFAGISLALLLTIVRASWLAFLVSILVIMLMGASRRALVAGSLLMLLVMPAALFFLHQKRNVGFYDRSDGSITWRETVYREGLQLLFRQPRHLLVGVGSNSIERHHDQWGLFDNGRLPPSHLHSTPLALAVERGLPTLIVWLALLFFYGRLLFYLLRSQQLEDWFERGLMLGALGGLAGFFLSGLVNYNLGHWQVVIIFYLIMGLTISIEKRARAHAAAAVSLNRDAPACALSQKHGLA